VVAKIQTAGSSITGSINSGIASLDQQVAGLGASQTKRTTPPLRDTELTGVMKNGDANGWPRVAVNINRLPSWFYLMPPSGTPGRFSAQDCINISVTLWTGPKKSKSFDHIDFCGDDIVYNTSFSNLIVWKNFAFIAGATANTGTRRTMGPLPPQRQFPNNPGTDMFLTLNGNYYLGSIMATIGFNWNEPQDSRFWVVNVPTMQDSKSGTETSIKLPS
jgi:hypothetical protein